MDDENVISNKDDIKYDMKHDIKDVITEQKNTNPWHMTSITDFLYYCCAECNFIHILPQGCGSSSNYSCCNSARYFIPV